MKNVKVTVIGLGNSGLNAALLLKGIGSIVKVTECADNAAVRKNAELLKRKNIPYEVGAHTKEFISASTIIVTSPGVEESSLAIRWANEFKIPIISEMELGYMYCKGRIIAITGTNGKSTVTTLVGDILKEGGLDTVVCGNIGNSLCGEIDRIDDRTWVVLEVSSFQLERIRDFKPRISVILNIRDDHMDRYSKLSDYFREKMKIFKNQDEKDILILNRDAGELEGVADKSRARIFHYSRLSEVRGAYLDKEDIFCNVSGSRIKICGIGEIKLKGLHNVENVLASSLIGILAGVKQGSIKNTLKNFNGLSHRFETIRNIDSVEYIDDSKGTTVDSTYRALQSCDRPVILIAGGKDKNSDYAVIKDIVKEKVKYLILIGEAKSRIKDALGGVVNTHEAPTMDEAVKIARRLAGKDYMVLLSPMCSSFDMFKDYKERGDIFKKAVLSLK